MSRCPFAQWHPIPENSTQPKIVPTQIILHTAVDAPGETDLYGYFARGDVTVESHFFIQNDGDVIQYMDTAVRADANRDANVRAVSIETEDDGAPTQNPWTPAQLVALERLILWLHAQHDIPLRTCPAWDQPGVGWHAMWGAPSHWTPAAGKTCPGPLRIRQAQDLISQLQAGVVTAPAPTPVPQEDDDMALLAIDTDESVWVIGLTPQPFALGGLPAVYDALLKKGSPVIEDRAQAHELIARAKAAG